MRKPWWLRLVGWLDIAAWVLTAAFIYRWGSGFHAPDVAVGLFLFAFIAVVVGAVWFILSALLWGMNRQARTSAAVLRDAMAAKDRAGRGVAPAANGKGEPAATPGSIVPMCDMCKSASVLACRVHGNRLCWEHARLHDSQGCLYSLSAREAPTAVAYEGGKRPVHGESLGRIR